MAWDGIPTIEIVLGRHGIFGVRNGREIPLGAAKTLRNATLEDGTYRTMGGTSLLGEAIGSLTVQAAFDFWPDTDTQRTLVSLSDGSLRKDDGSGASWASLASGLTTSGQVPLWVMGGAEEVGRSRKAFHVDRINAPRVLAGDEASMTALANPPRDWSGGNQPAFLAPHRGFMWGGGNLNDPHRVYRSLGQDHEDYLTTTYTRVVFPGVGERLTFGMTYKGFLILWKYPEGVFAIDTRSDSEGAWEAFQVGQAGCAGPGNVVRLEDDILWVSPFGTFHLISLTSDAGSLRATDISAEVLGPYFRDNVNLAQLATAQWVYYSQKGKAMLACHGQGQTNKDRLLELDVLRAKDIGLRWLLHTRDRNEALFLRKTSGIQVPHFGDNAGSIYTMDRPTRAADGESFEFQWEIWDDDFARLSPGWAGRKKNGRFIQLEYDPKSAGTHSIDVIRDGTVRQTVDFTLGAASGALPVTLPHTFGANAPQFTPRKVLKGQFYRLGLRGRTSILNQEVSVMRVILGIEEAA